MYFSLLNVILIYHLLTKKTFTNINLFQLVPQLLLELNVRLHPQFLLAFRRGQLAHFVLLIILPIHFVVPLIPLPRTSFIHLLQKLAHQQMVMNLLLMLLTTLLLSLDWLFHQQEIWEPLFQVQLAFPLELVLPKLELLQT